MSYHSYSASGGGSISGGASSTDNALVRWDGTAADTIQDSGVTLDDSNNLTGIVALTVTGTTTLAVVLTGVLKGTSGVVSAGNVDLTSEVTGALPILNGGTGQTTANPAFNALSPVTTRGDLIYRNATVNARLAIGAANTILKSDGTDPSYGSVVNADVDASAAIAYSKLNLSTSILNADISASAAIAVNKLAALTASEMVISDGSGFLASASVSTYPSLTELAHVKGVTGAIQTQMDTKAPLLSPVLTTPQINDTSSDHQYIFAVSELTLDRTVTLPLLTGNDEFVFKDHAVVFANKTIASASNTLTIDADVSTVSNIKNAEIKAAAAISVNKLAALTASEMVISDGSGFLASAAVATYPSLTELTYVKGVTSAIQTQIDTKAVIADIFSMNADSGVFTATANETYIVDTSGGVGTITLPAVATDIFVRIKDNGSAETNNITVSPASGTIDGAASDVIDSNFGSVIYVSDGITWFKL